MSELYVAGPVGVSGPVGPTGITGVTGLQGLRGIRGPPIGPTGPPFIFSASTARLNVTTPSSSPISLAYVNLGTYYNITSNLTSDGNFVITLPGYSPSYATNNTAISTASNLTANVITYTTSSAHRLQVNSLVSVTGVSGFSAANVSNATVTTVPSSNQFTLAVTSTGGSGTGGVVSNTIGTELVSETDPTPEHAGWSWFFRNNLGMAATPTISNGPVYMNGIAVNQIYIAQGQGVMLTYNSSNGFVVM